MAGINAYGVANHMAAGYPAEVPRVRRGGRITMRPYRYGDVLGVTTCRCSQWLAGCGNLMLLCDFVRGSLIEDY